MAHIAIEQVERDAAAFHQEYELTQILKYKPKDISIAVSPVNDPYLLYFSIKQSIINGFMQIKENLGEILIVSNVLEYVRDRISKHFSMPSLKSLMPSKSNPNSS